MEKLKEYIGESNEFKKMKIKIFAIEADKEELYQLLKGNITDTGNKYYEQCKN